MATSRTLRTAALSTLGLLLVLYFLVPVLFLAPFRVAYVKGAISQVTYERANTLGFRPMEWLYSRIQPYASLLDAEWDLLVNLVPNESAENRPTP